MALKQAVISTLALVTTMTRPKLCNAPPDLTTLMRLFDARSTRGSKIRRLARRYIYQQVNLFRETFICSEQVSRIIEPEISSYEGQDLAKMVCLVVIYHVHVFLHTANMALATGGTFGPTSRKSS